MDSQSKKRKRNVEVDRLSRLPDDLIAKILSYNSIKQAVETSVLSSRWKSIWTLLPYLIFSSDDFSNKTSKFYEFLTHVISSCKEQVEFSLDLCGKVSMVLVNNILNDAFSRNIQKLTFTILDELVKFDLSIFNSESLKHLTLAGATKHCFITLETMWNLPSLTTLHLRHIRLYNDNTHKCTAGLFSKCSNLKDLTLDNCRITGLGSFTISHPQLSNLTFKNGNRYSDINIFNVVTPQLKNLAIIDCNEEYIIRAPNLTSLLYKNWTLRISVDQLPTLERVDLCVSHVYGALPASKVVDLLQKFYNVGFLTLSLEIIELICSSIKLIEDQPSPFLNLKSLRIYPELLYECGVIIPCNAVKNYFLDNSPSATFSMVSRKEVEVARHAKSVQDLIEKLRVRLDQEKSLMKSQKAKMRPQQKKKRRIDMSKRVALIKNYWEDLNEHINKGKTKTMSIVELIQRIKKLLIKLPTSKKVEMQPDFSSLCAEAEVVINKIVKRMNKKQCSLSVCFHELVTEANSYS